MTPMNRMAVLLVVAAIAAGAVALASRNTAPEAPHRDHPEAAAGESLEALGSAVAELRELVGQQSAEQARMQEELWQLRTLLAALEPGEPAAPGRAERERPSEDPPARRGAHSRGRTELDPEVLARVGFRRDEVERFQGRLDAIALARLDLRDRAVREGWIGTPRFRQESQQLGAERTALREEFGKDLYDWSLYTSGQPNRVAVKDVMQGGAASAAGLQAGDLIVTYAGRSILSPHELRQTTVEGTRGETVAVDLQRGDESLRLYVPRGPLGVQVEPVVREPEPPR